MSMRRSKGLDLRGRTIVLTGAGGGIGSALTAELIAAGACVIAVGRDGARLARLRAQHPDAAIFPLAADVTGSEGRKAIVAEARARGASILILAHAQAGFGLFAEQGEEALRRSLETNLIAPTLLIRALLPALQAQAATASAAVVAIGSTFGSLAYPGFAAYSAAKHGLRGLIEALAREHADGAVRFQYLAPRATRTAFNSPAVEAMNRELKVAHDEPAQVARALRVAIENGDVRRQLGWPEALFARLNGLFPGLIDRSLKKQLPVIRRYAAQHTTDTHALPIENRHDSSPA